MTGSSSVCHWREPIVSKFLDCNRWLAVPGVHDPDSSAWAFCRASAQGCSLNVRWNRYSYGTAGTDVGFGGEVMGLKPPWSWLRILWWYPPYTALFCTDDLMKPHNPIWVAEGGATCTLTPSMGVLITWRGWTTGTCLVKTVPEFVSWLIVWDLALQCRVKIWVESRSPCVCES
jgi:hypothetical protein